MDKQIQLKSCEELSAMGYTSVPQPSQKTLNLLLHPRKLGRVTYESSLPELSRHVWHLCQKLNRSPLKTRKTIEKWANFLATNFHCSS